MTCRLRASLALALVLGISGAPALAEARGRAPAAARSVAAAHGPSLRLPRSVRARPSLPPRGPRDLAPRRPRPLPVIEGTDVGPDWTIPDHYAGSCEPGPEEDFETQTCDPPDDWEP